MPAASAKARKAEGKGGGAREERTDEERAGDQPQPAGYAPVTAAIGLGCRAHATLALCNPTRPPAAGRFRRVRRSARASVKASHAILTTEERRQALRWKPSPRSEGRIGEGPWGMPHDDLS